MCCCTSVLQVAIDARALLEAADSPLAPGSSQALAVERAEEVAAVAMKAAEVAVKEEMQAQAVVKVGRGRHGWLHACGCACMSLTCDAGAGGGQGRGGGACVNACVSPWDPGACMYACISVCDAGGPMF